MKKHDLVYCKKDCREFIENQIHIFDKNRFYKILDYDKTFDKVKIGGLWMTTYSSFFADYFYTLKESRKLKLNKLKNLLGEVKEYLIILFVEQSKSA